MQEEVDLEVAIQSARDMKGEVRYVRWGEVSGDLEVR